MPLCHLCSLLREMVRCCRGFAECSDVALMLHQAEGVTGSSCFRSVLAAGHFSVSSSFFCCHKRGQWLRYQSAATSPNTPMVPPGPAQPQGSHNAKKLQEGWCSRAYFGCGGAGFTVLTPSSATPWAASLGAWLRAASVLQKHLVPVTPILSQLSHGDKDVLIAKRGGRGEKPQEVQRHPASPRATATFPRPPPLPF